MRDIESDLINEIVKVMRKGEKTQKDFADFKGVSRQSVNPYFTGERALLTGTGAELLEFLGVTIRLVPVEKSD